MTFLPIVERELRTAARRKSTYRIRWVTALIAMAGSLLVLMFIGLAGGPANLGNQLFIALSGYAFALCMLGGVMLTSDCLSEERREGTLGLLFLTDLKGYDVVLGKFVARSLNAFYGLVALLPVLAVPLLLGGVTPAEFWRMVLALLNALFYSLAAGICVSATARDPQRALLGALGLVLLLGAVLPGLVEFSAVAGIRAGWLGLAYVGPFYPFLWAREMFYPSHAGVFWEALAGSALIGCGFLALASWRLPRLAQEQGVLAGSTNRWVRFLLIGVGTSGKPARRRPRLLNINPILWLVGGGGGLRSMIWGVVAMWGLVVFWVAWQQRIEFGSFLVPSKVCGFLFKMLVAVQACRFFSEARQNGALELLFCTPLRNHEFLHGQWLAMKRLVVWPIIIAVLLAFVPFGAQTVIALASAGIKPIGPTEVIMALSPMAWGVLTIGWFSTGLLVDIYAVTWVGMWLALSSKRPASAPVRTIFFVLILPAVGICGADMLVDLFLILWSSSQLHQDFRWMHAQLYRAPPGSLASPPVLVTFGPR